VGKFSTQSISGAGLQLPGVEIPKLFGPGSLFYSFGPQLFWPLFNYGRIQNNIRLQDAGFQQQLVGYRSTVLKAAQEVEDGMTGYLRAQEATAFAQNAARAAQRSVDLAVIQYREGAVDFQRVLDAQRSLLQEENNLARTRSSVATYLISLYKALGGGWQMRQSQPFVSRRRRPKCRSAPTGATCSRRSPRRLPQPAHREPIGHPPCPSFRQDLDHRVDRGRRGARVLRLPVLAVEAIRGAERNRFGQRPDRGQAG
jgi:hypothetical protein